VVNAATDEQLLLDYLSGAPGAFEELVRRHFQELHQFVLRFTNNASAADDIVQDAFVQMHQSAANFDPSRRLKPWLFTIAANKARDYLRSRSRRQEVPLDAQIGTEGEGGQRFADLLADPATGTLDELAAEETRQLVRNVVDRLPPNLREVLVLAYFHRFPYKELAEILNIPLGTVKSRLHAAVAEFGAQYRAAVEARSAAADETVR
jgi:RNA polymerase sigma-70 factor (ECF subfamily)